MSSTYIPSALRRLIYDRAKGCCEYCRISEATAFAAHEIDHIIAEKHGGLTECATINAIASSPSALKESDRSMSFARASNYYQRVDNSLVLWSVS